MPNGDDGVVNEEGVRFYSDLIDELLAHKIEPFVTIFHWDLPQALQDRFSGWLGPKDRIVPAFGNYSRTLFSLFGNRVKNWITLNEPWCVAKTTQLPGFGNFMVKSPMDAPYAAAHNMLLAHAEAAHIYRSEFKAAQGGHIGITLNLDWNEPKDAGNPMDVQAAERANDFMLGWFAGPVFFGQYPDVMRSELGTRLPEFTAKEIKHLKGSADFLGINNYFGKLVTPATSPFNINFLAGADVKVQLLEDPQWQLDDGGRPITPWAFRKLLLYVQAKYAPPEGIYVTENGVPAEPQETLKQGEPPPPKPYRADGAPPPHEDWDTETFEDPRRVQFLKAYLEALHAAKKKGADVRGYFVWSLMDNFEWSNYKTRFGIVHVDFDTQKRTLKRSARMYSEVIKHHGLLTLPSAQRYPGEVA